MAEANLYDRVRASIEQENAWIARRLTIIQEVLEAMESAQHPLEVADLWEMFEKTRTRFEEKRLVIVVSGLTSSGKSSLINALLGLELLFTAPDHCTPCSVSVECSPHPHKAFFNDDRSSEDTERDIAELWKATDSKSESPSRRPLFAFLSATQADHGVLRVGRQLRLVDSPGIHESSFKNCDLEADAFAFVVDLTCGTKWTDLAEILQTTGLRNKPVLVVFSKCDEIQRHCQRRFDIECEKRKQEASDFLEANGMESENAIFFLSPRAAVTKRRHDSELEALRGAILEATRGGSESRVALVVGADRSGKTSLVADLIGSSIPIAGGQRTPCFVIYAPEDGRASKVRYDQLSQEEQSLPVDDENPLTAEGAAEVGDNFNPTKTFVSEDTSVSLEEELRNTIDAATDSNPSNVIHVDIVDETLLSDSLLTEGFTVVDTPPLEDLQDLPTGTKPSVAAVVITSDGRPREHRNRIKRCLRIAQANADTSVFLAVTKWKEFRDQQASSEIVEEWKRGIEEVFSSCCCQQPSNDVRRVFYIESESLMEEYDASFTKFEKRLIKAGHDEFATFKLKAIKNAETELLQEMETRIDKKLQVLDRAEAFFQEFPSSISEKFLTATDETVTLLRQTRASRFLNPSLQLPDTESHMKEFFCSFLTYYREDVTNEILKLSRNVLERFEDVDEVAKANAQTFHDSQMKAIATQLDLEGSEGDDFYGLRNMLETFMTFMPGSIDEESHLKIQELKESGDRLFLLLNTLKTKETLTATEVEKLQRKMENMKSISNDIDVKLAEDLTENLTVLEEILTSMIPRIEERNQIAAEMRRNAEKTYEDGVKKIGDVETVIKEVMESLMKQQYRWSDQRRSIFMRFMNFLMADYFIKKSETECWEKKEKIQRSFLEILGIEEKAQDADKAAVEREDEAHQYEMEYENLSQKKTKMEEDLEKICQRVHEAKEKMENDKRKIMTRHEVTREELQRQRSEIQETEKVFEKNQEEIRSAESAFLEQKNKWDDMKREYYQKLLSELEKMSNMLLRKILHDLYQRTCQFANSELEMLRNEKQPLSELRKKLSTLLSE